MNFSSLRVKIGQDFACILSIYGGRNLLRISDPRFKETLGLIRQLLLIRTSAHDEFDKRQNKTEDVGAGGVLFYENVNDIEDSVLEMCGLPLCINAFMTKI
jgi:hypothetical protein